VVGVDAADQHPDDQFTTRAILFHPRLDCRGGIPLRQYQVHIKLVPAA
jgi:hypothetical protein